MEHRGTIKIETTRLVLRPFEMTDVQAAFDNWTSDDKVTKYLRWPPHTGVDVTEKIFGGWVASYQNKKYYQ